MGVLHAPVRLLPLPEHDDRSLLAHKALYYFDCQRACHRAARKVQDTRGAGVEDGTRRDTGDDQVGLRATYEVTTTSTEAE